MAKLTPIRTFLLRQEDGKDVVARKGEKIEVTDDEHKKLGTQYFKELYGKKKS